MECQTCSGLRFVLVERPKRWYQSGTSAVIGTHRVNELCPDCNGTGLAVDPARDPDCSWCHGTGETHAYCSSGDWVPEVCGCVERSLRFKRSEKPANPIEAELLARLEAF